MCVEKCGEWTGEPTVNSSKKLLVARAACTRSFHVPRLSVCAMLCPLSMSSPGLSGEEDTALLDLAKAISWEGASTPGQVWRQAM